MKHSHRLVTEQRKLLTWLYLSVYHIVPSKFETQHQHFQYNQTVCNANEPELWNTIHVHYRHTRIAGKLASDQCTKIEVLAVASKFCAWPAFYHLQGSWLAPEFRSNWTRSAHLQFLRAILRWYYFGHVCNMSGCGFGGIVLQIGWDKFESL